ncbi:rab GTPase-binding effector protein 1-like isoform X2 [Branchiostoma floridae]|uniref:Rab GTPase-binding effector protein 1-like isoform X2 n=1 Tax=Branchiostoma floridae TaxID=7739 RepID=A0A9J7LYZ1_BRAFL|nr:rab GTPase-binding effector protein 1-like isoform X2 [Branchiostoma floridae]
MEQEDIANADVDTLRSRVEELQKEKNEMEKDFAQKRGKFKEIFLAKEEELRKEHQKRGEYQQTVDSLQKQVQTLQAEVDDLKTTNTILETTKQDEVDEIRRKCQEEIASLQAIMKEAARDASQATASKYESRFEEERSRWSRYQEKMEQQLQELKEKMAEPKEESVLASVAKSLRMVSMGASPSSTTTSTSTSLSTEDENLEAHMKKAQEEAEMLRSVVMPMEKEITSLKEKLRLSQDRIRELEGRPRAATVSDPTSVEVPTVDTGIRASTSEVLLKEGEDLGEKVRELNHYLEVEKSSRTDLEMYVAVLNTQKTVLQEDADKLRSELHDVCRLLEEEKRKHAELKKTWELANDQFLESQRLMLADLKRMSGVLSEEQQRQVQELQKQDAEREAQQKRIQQLQQMRDEQERLQQQQQQQREFFSTFLAPLQSTPRAKELVGEQSDSSATSTPTQEVKSQATTTSSLSPPAVVKSQVLREEQKSVALNKALSLPTQHVNESEKALVLAEVLPSPTETVEISAKHNHLNRSSSLGQLHSHPVQNMTNLSTLTHSYEDLSSHKVPFSSDQPARDDSESQTSPISVPTPQNDLNICRKSYPTTSVLSLIQSKLETVKETLTPPKVKPSSPSSSVEYEDDLSSPERQETPPQESKLKEKFSYPNVVAEVSSKLDSVRDKLSSSPSLPQLQEDLPSAQDFRTRLQKSLSQPGLLVMSKVQSGIDSVRDRLASPPARVRQFQDSFSEMFVPRGGSTFYDEELAELDDDEVKANELLAMSESWEKDFLFIMPEKDGEEEPSKEFQPKPPPPAVVIQLNMKEVKPEPPSPAPPMRKKRLQRLLSGPEAVPKLSSSKTSLGSSSARSSTASISTQKSEESAHSPSTEEAIIRRTQSSSCIEGDTLNVGSMSLLERPKSAENLASSQSSEEFGPFVSGDEDRVSQLSFTLTEAQQKAITAQTPENEEVQTLVAAAKASSSEPSASMVGKRLVSDKEWEWLQQEVKAAREKLGRPCDMCSNYEQQLQNVQESEKDVRDTMAKLQSDLEREQKNREKREKNMEELEESVKNAGQDAQQQLTYFTFKHEESEKFLTDVRQQFLRWQNDTTEQMKLLVESREQVYNELQRLQRENDSLQGKYTLHKSLQQSEGFVMPQGLEELQTLISRYRQNILTVKTSAEHMEDKLRSEIMFLKDRVKAEQVAKDNIEETLSSDLDVARDEMVKLQNIKTDYDKEKTEKTELEAKLNELQQSKKSIETKSKQVITALQQQVEELTALKTKLEAEVRDLRVKIQGLQADLDNSEAVQRDFVKLSQSLQVQLENIRQSENEVRWQHEEDATGCHQCKQPFQPKKKATKHHCRHCGKIFCNDCLSKSVQSGPNMRPSKVCDVCYTILVNDSAPYFSTTPPTTA